MDRERQAHDGRSRPGSAGSSFALASFLPLSDSLADGAKVSPWYYYNSSDPLTNGADLLHLVVLLVLAAVALALGTIGLPSSRPEGLT